MLVYINEASATTNVAFLAHYTVANNQQLLAQFNKQYTGLGHSDIGYLLLQLCIMYNSIRR
jgi:hypothetical protein